MKNFVCALAGTLAVVATAQGAESVFQFKSSVQTIEYSFKSGRDETLPTVTLPSGTVSIGDTVTGTFSYDAAATAMWSDWGRIGYAPATTTFRIGTNTPVGGRVAESGSVWVYDNSRDPSGDGMFLSSDYFSNNYHDTDTLGVILEDPSDTVLNGYQLPTTELTGFRSGRFFYSFYTWTADDGYWYSYRWTITGEITSIAAIPEPTTYGMLLAGLGLVAWRRKRA